MMHGRKNIKLFVSLTTNELITSTQPISEGDYKFWLQDVIYYWSVTGVSYRWWYGGRHFDRNYVNMASERHNNLVTVLLI